MKNILSLILFAIAFSCAPSSAQEWKGRVVSEDAVAFYYVGVSDGKISLKDAMNEAYLEALKEATRHSFGFTQSYVESYLSTTDRAEIFGQMNLEAPAVLYKGVTPYREEIKENHDGTYRVIRQICYQKKAREEEIIRQMEVHKKTEVTQKVTKGDGPMGEITIRTKPAGALVTLTKAEGDFQVQATSNALFKIPLGKYRAIFHLPNFLPKEETLLLTPASTSVDVVLERGKGKMKMNIRPSDALVFINNLPSKDRSLSLAVGEDYQVRVEHPDYFPENRTFSPWFNEEIELSIQLRPRNGRITVMGSPADAEVYLNGVFQGVTPLFKREATPGRVTMEIRKSGFKNSTQEVNIEANRDMAPMTYTLERLPLRNPASSPAYSLQHEGKSQDAFDKARFNFSYNPLSMENGKTVFYTLPFAFNVFAAKRVSFGAEWKFYSGKEEINGIEYEEEYQAFSLNSRFYIFRTPYFSLGIGLEFNRRLLRYTPTQGGYGIHEAEVSESSFGGNLQLSVPIGHEKKSGWGLVSDYKQMDFSNPNLKVLTVGVYFEF
ncbi:MAG: PEGA domain-containing protein [Bdellovibrio sp.]|nr:PEGA domain-containing protein [Bdellovibrio sp.]